MYIVYPAKEYKRNLKKMSSQKKFDEDALNTVIDLLVGGGTLPKKYKDHQLKGRLYLCRELHVKSDLLLVYTKNNLELVLVLITIGTHSSLFES